MKVNLDKIAPFCTKNKEKQLLTELNNAKKLDIVEHGTQLMEFFTQLFIAKKYEPLEILYPDLLKFPFSKEYAIWEAVETLLGLCFACPWATNEQKEVLKKRHQELNDHKKANPEVLEAELEFFPNLFEGNQVEEYQKYVENSIKNKDLSSEQFNRRILLQEAIRKNLTNESDELKNIIQEQAEILISDRFSEEAIKKALNPTVKKKKSTLFTDIQVFLKDNPLENEKDFLENEEIIWIDWREYDEDIVIYVSEELPKAQEIVFSSEINLNTNEETYFLTQKKRKMPFPYQNGVMERDITLKTIGEFIAETHQLCLLKPSLGSDTLGFIVLNNEDWEKLLSEFGKEKTTYFFSPVTDEKTMFNLGIGEIEQILKKRKAKKSF